jgi:hypothetical protein
MNILFLTHHYPNYVPDLLLHGLRKLFGEKVVDYPRKDCLYNGILGLVTCPEDQLCPNWFPTNDRQIDRDDISVKISKGYFKYIICDIRAILFPEGIRSLISQWPSGLVIIDGEDNPSKILPGPYVICRRETDGTDFSIPLPMALPEEIFKWITSYKNNDKKYSIGFLGCIGHFSEDRKNIVETIAKHYPDSLLHATLIPSETNPNPTGRFGRDEYYRNLQKCKLVLTLHGAGYDTFRFWENTACNAVHISQKMPLLIPYDFENGKNILSFSNIEELRRLIDNVLEDKIESQRIIQEGHQQLINFHLTTKRAAYLLDRLGKIF